MDYWMYVNCRREKNKEIVTSIVQKLKNLGLDIPTLDLDSRVILLLSQSNHTEIVEEKRTINLNIKIAPFELEEMETLKNLIKQIGFDVKENKIERESRIMYQMKIVDNSVSGGIKWRSQINKPEIK